MSEPTPLHVLDQLSKQIGITLGSVKPHFSPVVTQYQLACIRDLATEMYMLSARLTKQLQDDAKNITKKEDTNG